MVNISAPIIHTALTLNVKVPGKEISRLEYSLGGTANKNLDIVCINALTLNVKRISNPRLNTDSPLGVTANNRSESRTQWNWHLSTTMIPTLQNKQTNKQTQLVSAFKVPKGETKVWAIATATVPRGVKVNKHQVERAKLFTQLGTGSRDTVHLSNFN